MPLVRLKDKGQVTIPASVRDEIEAREGDLFEIAVSDGMIVLRPQQVVERPQSASRKSPRASKGSVDISRWVGAGKGGFKSAEEAEAFIRGERDRWE